VGWKVGVAVGSTVGAAVGSSVGANVGEAVGACHVQTVGSDPAVHPQCGPLQGAELTAVGAAVGGMNAVGSGVLGTHSSGISSQCGALVGAGVGSPVGLLVGAAVGACIPRQREIRAEGAA
jgi:hypothetical protein